MSKSHLQKTLLKNTFREMVNEFKYIDGISCNRLNTLVNALTEAQLIESLKNMDSSLCKSIPIKALQEESNGKKYLDLLGMFQPQFKPTVQVTTIPELMTMSTPDLMSSMSMLSSMLSATGLDTGINMESMMSMMGNKDYGNLMSEVKTVTKSNAEKLMSPQQNIPKLDFNNLNDLFSQNNVPEGLKNLLLPNENNNELISLASDIFNKINLGNDLSSFDPSNLDMSKIMNMYQEIGDYMKEKVESGEIDMELIKEQASSLCENIQQTPEVQEVLSSNPQITSLLSTVMTPKETFDDSDESDYDDLD